MDTDATLSPLHRIAHLFEQLHADRLDTLAQIYAPQATFQDPFNRVQGLTAITAQFAHMYAKLHAPRFVVKDVTMQGAVGWMVWDFHFALRKGAPLRVIEGATRFRLDAQGLVVDHRDYWDACDFYATVPVLGAVVRRLKRAAAA
ncbi:MAG: nuclear transport factor 2 family protein [Thiomonas sp.]|nr:nuclear transport factor 2 family protein [Thiomonas sp.]